MLLKKLPDIKCLFLDIGGVLLTDGWDRESRKKAGSVFEIEPDEMEDRHHLVFETYELGRLSMDEYLKDVVFYKKRNFSVEDFKKFMYAQSMAHPEMIKLFMELKNKYKLKVGVVSNEGRELNHWRIWEFKLNLFIDFFISSCFVHLRKPDREIFQMALDIAQVEPSNIIYVDDQILFVQLAEYLGMHGIHHINFKTTLEKLNALGLQID